jgi:hypothetical protein
MRVRARSDDGADVRRALRGLSWVVIAFATVFVVTEISLDVPLAAKTAIVGAGLLGFGAIYVGLRAWGLRRVDRHGDAAGTDLDPGTT